MTARELTVDEFGAFALVLPPGLLALSVIRGLTSEVLVVRFTDPDAEAWRWGAQGVQRRRPGDEPGRGARVRRDGRARRRHGRGELLALAASLPGVAVQDSLRYAALAAKRP